MVLLKGSQKITVAIGEVFFTSEGLRTPDMSLFRAKKKQPSVIESVQDATAE